MLRIAFASVDRVHVDQLFGAAEGFVIYTLDGGKAALSAVAEFPASAMDGNEDKLATRIEFLQGCAAVFVLAVGGSAIKQLMAKGIQPIRVTESDRIDTLLAEVQAGLLAGGVPWIERALAVPEKAAPTEDRFAIMEAEGWQG